MKVHNLVVTGSLQSGGENITSISSSVASTVTNVSSSVSASIGQLSSSMASSMTSLSSSLTSSMGSLSSSMVTTMNGLSSYMATTGSNIFVGNQTISGSIVPAVNGAYDLGSSTHEFRHLYLSSASLYIDGTKVLGSTTQELQITTDAGQSFKILEAGSDTITLQSADGNITLATSGGGDVILDPTSGIIALKGTTTLYAGNRLLSSDGNAIQIGNSATITGSLIVTGFIETQELRTTYISSSILYRSGSTKFGDELGDTHSFTGSLTVSGSISVPGSGLVSGSSQITYSGLSGVPSGIISGSAQLPSGLISGSSQVLSGTGIWSGSAQLPSGVVSGSAQVDVMSTTNIARLATTGSNTFNGTLSVSTTTADYAATITNVQDSSQGLLVRSTDNDSSLYLLSLQSSTGATSQTWVDRFSVTKQGYVGVGYSSPAYQLQVLNTIGLRANSQNFQAIKGTGWGYSPGSYRVVMLGDSDIANFTTVSIGYDPSGNSNGAFNGNGTEVLFRNGASFATPTSGNTSFHLNTFVMKDGKIGISTDSPSKLLTVNFGTGISDGLLVTGSQRQETRFKSSGEHSNVFIDSAHSNIYLPTLGLYRNGTSLGEVKLQRASNSDALGNFTESEMIVGTTTNTPLSLKVNEERLVILSSSSIRIKSTVLPTADATYNLGSTSLRWNNLYTTDLHLSNEGKQNVVDGTWGDWTLQEGENDIYMLNNRSGEKFKIKLEKIIE